MILPSALPRLRRIAFGFDQPDDREWLADALRRYLAAADDGLTLDDAFELSTPGRALPWWRIDALARRDMALRELARVFFPSPSLTQRAAQVHAALLRYSRTGWPRDRRFDSVPDDHVGKPEEIVFFALKACPEILSERQLLRILAQSHDIGGG